MKARGQSSPAFPPAAGKGTISAARSAIFPAVFFTPASVPAAGATRVTCGSTDSGRGTGPTPTSASRCSTWIGTSSRPRRRTVSTASAPANVSTISICWRNSTNRASGSSNGRRACSTSGLRPNRWGETPSSPFPSEARRATRAFPPPHTIPMLALLAPRVRAGAKSARQRLAPPPRPFFRCSGRWSRCYVPAVGMNGVGLRASHNLIHDHPHCAILFTGNDHLIEFNDIHHIALETGDVGAIYTGRDYTFRGNRIRHNHIHETGGVGMGSMGVYMDDCVSGTEVFGNVFYKVHWAVLLGGGRDHRVKNNLFVDCDPAVRADGRGLDSTPVWRDMVDTYMRRELAAVPSALYRERYPELKSLDAWYGPPGGPV